MTRVQLPMLNVGAVSVKIIYAMAVYPGCERWEIRRSRRHKRHHVRGVTWRREQGMCMCGWVVGEYVLCS